MKGASVSLTGQMIARALQMVANLFMARFLGAAQFGLYAIGWTLVRLLGTVGTLGMEAGATYFGTRYQTCSAGKFKGVVFTAIATSSISGLALGAVVWLVAPILSQYVFHKPASAAVIRGFSLAFVFYAVGIVAAGVTKLSQQMQYAAYCTVAQAVFTLLLFLALFALGWGVHAAVIATVFGLAVSALLPVFFVRRLFRRNLSKGVKAEWVGREFFTFSSSIMLAGLAHGLLMFIDRLFVACVLSSAEMGIYQVASQLSLLFGILLGAFHSIFRPMVADLYSRGERARLKDLYQVSSKWTLYASLPLFLMIVCVPSRLIQFMYGSVYLPAVTPLVIISAGQVLTLMTAASHTMLVMTGRQRAFVAVSLGALSVDIALNGFLVLRFGLAGAAIAGVVANVALNATTVTMVRREFGIWPLDARYIKGLIAAAVTFVALSILPSGGAVRPAVTMLLVSVTSIAVFLGCLGALGLDDEDREVLSLLRGRLLAANS